MLGTRPAHYKQVTSADSFMRKKITFADGYFVLTPKIFSGFEVVQKIKDIFILVKVLQPLFPKIQGEPGQRHLPGFAFLSRLLLRELTVSRTSVLKCCSGGLTPGPCSCKMWWKTRSASVILDSFWEASSDKLGKSGKD